MNFIKNVKLNFLLKLIKQAIDDKNHENLKKSLDELKKINKEKYDEFFKTNINDLVVYSDFDFLFKKKFIWTSSFNMGDLNIINKTISDLLLRTLDHKINNNNFYEKVIEFSSDSDIKQFSNNTSSFFSSHYYFQKILENETKHPYELLSTQSAFFEFDGKLHFTNHKFTKCFFYIFKHPYDILVDLKTSGLSSAEALNVICNFDKRPNIVKSKSGRTIPEFRESWSVNMESWHNPNALSSLRGLPISLEKASKQTEDTVFEISAHLRESGIEINIDNETIRSISDLFKNIKSSNNNQISNHEKKIIDRDCGETIDKYINGI